MPDRPVSGFLNICKGPGETSHTIVARVRRAIGERRVGHAGTLDPAAVGVLPIAVGNSTRLTMATGWGIKSYWADVRFGVETTTDDAEGAVTEVGDAGGITREELAAALVAFLGATQQTPPIYSAVHVDGERSYRRARQGEHKPPPAREVQIDGIRLAGWAPPVASLVVQCHSGTYIRALARDLGRAVGCPAHLAALIRLRVGPFRLEDSIRIERLEAACHAGDWQRFLWSSDVAVEDLGTMVLDETTEQNFLHGRRWTDQVTQSAERVRAYSQSGRFLGLAEIEDGQWQPTVVLQGNGSGDAIPSSSKGSGDAIPSSSKGSGDAIPSSGKGSGDAIPSSIGSS